MTGTPLPWYIVAAYVVVIVQTFRSSRIIVPLTYDSGGVTTSTVTVPVSPSRSRSRTRSVS